MDPVPPVPPVNPNLEAAKPPLAMSEAVENILKMNADHTALARDLIRNNFKLLEQSKVLLREYGVLRDFIVQTAPALNGPAAFTARRVAAQSGQRINSHVDAIDRALGNPTPTQPDGAA